LCWSCEIAQNEEAAKREKENAHAASLAAKVSQLVALGYSQEKAAMYAKRGASFEKAKKGQLPKV
jgi:hypothetical protein